MFGLYNYFCVLKFDENIKKLIDRNTTELNVLEKQFRVIKFKQGKEKNIIIKLTHAILDLQNMTDEYNIRIHLSNHFIQVSLMLELYIFETSILFNVIQTARVELIQPNLLKPK